MSAPMRKGAPNKDKHLDKRTFSAPAIRLLPDREVESAKGEKAGAAIVRA